MARSCGAVAVGIAKAGDIDTACADSFDRWIAAGRNATMDYLARHAPLRRNPSAVLPGAASVISMAFPYRPAGGYHHPHIADYALGRDYHIVLRERLAPMVEMIAREYGAMARVCVDSAPMAERYWAVKAGVGFVGRNCQLIVPCIGSGVFLCEVVTTLELPADAPCGLSCYGCGRCIRACPGGALKDCGGFDAGRCISYLTIEHRGDLPAGLPGGMVYGCDVCQRVCPHNSGEPPEPLDEFRPDPRLLALDAAALANLSSGDWRRLGAGSARTRLRYSDFRRNLRAARIQF